MENLFLICNESKVENNGNLYGRFQLGPFFESQGFTFAHVLRRTLLSELTGLAILCVEIPGVSHEYSNLKGVKESVLDILLNLKQVAFISQKKFHKAEIGFLKVQGPAVIKSCHLKLPSFIKCVNPNQYIATLSDNGALEIKFMICKGKNFLIETPFESIQKYFQSHFYLTQQNTENFFFENNLNEKFLNTNLKNKKFRNILSKHNKFKPNSGKFLQSKKLSSIYTKFKFFNHSSNEAEFTFGKSTKIKLAQVAKKNVSALINKNNFYKFEKKLIFTKKKHINLQRVRRNLDLKQNFKNNTFTNLLFIDLTFMPIKKVNFAIQNVNTFSKSNNLVSKFKSSSNKKKFLQSKILSTIYTKIKLNKDLSKTTKSFFAFPAHIFDFPNEKPTLLGVDLFNQEKQNFSLENQKKPLKEKIILEIWTNGSINPKNAIYQATNQIISLFTNFQEKIFYKKPKFIKNSKNFSLNQKSELTSTDEAGFYHERSSYLLSKNKKNQLLKKKLNNSHLNSKKLFPNINDSTIETKKNFFTVVNKIYRPWLTSNKLNIFNKKVILKQTITPNFNCIEIADNWLQSKNYSELNFKFVYLKNYFFKHQKNNTTYGYYNYNNKKIKYKILGEHILKSLDITYLNLSPKLYIFLKRANINTINQLLSYSHNELLLIKNLKQHSVKEIQFLLQKMNFKLRNDIA